MSGAAVLPPDGLGGLLLDIDDTLLSTQEAMHRAVTAATLATWPDVDGDRALAAGPRYRDDPGGHFRAYTRGEHDLEAMRTRRVEDLAQWLELVIEDDATTRWREHFDGGLLDGLTVFDDVRPTLDLCHERRVPVALLTNAGVAITADKLARCGLADLLAERAIPLLTKDTLGIGKPAPEVFHRGAHELGLPPSRVAYVGDELDVDPLAALDAGLGAAWIRREGYAVRPADLELASRRGLAPFPDLASAVEALLTADRA